MDKWGGRKKRGTYRAMPSRTNFIVKNFPSVGTFPLNVGCLSSVFPYFSTKFHSTSYKIVAHTVPIVCTALIVLTLLYVYGFVVRLVEYR